MVNNFKQIGEILKFEKPTDFYFIQILKRRKDNPEMDKHVRVIYSYYLYSLDDLWKLESKIVEKCDINNARAYIYLNRRNMQTVAYQSIRLTAELIANGDYKAVKDVYNSCCGQYSDEKKDKKWVIDIDDTIDQKVIDSVMGRVANLHLQANKKGNVQYKIIATLSSKSGIHIITNPFNMDNFKKDYPGIDVNKNSPTILYVN
jgi:hypothetical protein